MSTLNTNALITCDGIGKDAKRKIVQQLETELQTALAAKEQAERELAEARKALERLLSTLTPVFFIDAAVPTVASHGADFERGCPLTKSQVREIQAAAAAARKEAL